jgi:hypothetical protein
MGARLLAIPLIATVLLASLCIPAMADIPPYPPPRPAPPTTGPSLVIKHNQGIPNAVLTIPCKLLPAEAPKAKADTGLFSPTQTVVAGLAMTAALALGGIGLVRRRGRLAMAMWLLAGCVIVGASASLALANIAPTTPRQSPLPTVRMPANWPAAEMGMRKIPLTLKIVDEGDTAELSVDPALLEPPPASRQSTTGTLFIPPVRMLDPPSGSSLFPPPAQ